MVSAPLKLEGLYFRLLQYVSAIRFRMTKAKRGNGDVGGVTTHMGPPKCSLRLSNPLLIQKTKASYITICSIVASIFFSIISIYNPNIPYTVVVSIFFSTVAI